MMSSMQIPNVYCNFPYWIYQKIYNKCNMGRFLQLATFHEGIFFLTAYTNVAKGNKLHIEDLVRAVGTGGHCVLKYGFTQIFPRNQEVTVKLKSDLIVIKF